MKAVAIALALACGVGGCAHTQIDRGRQGVTIAVGIFSAGIEGLEVVDSAVQKDLIGKFRRGEISGDEAQAEYDAFGKKYLIAQQALAALWDALKGAANVLAAADAKLDADVPAAMAKLAAALANAVNALRDAGVKLPATA